ncbi:TIR domain-containing protein [Gordonia sp. KTR9]|uniref:TIR domain-containing protein n=1 Tax=Gordonia sp. KTR9 TaxID=337191 RepID=UPI00027DE029|nr:TIR domain-containing protein [Gordonia sp. KTR9]AFR50124.1 hypothetical protein KTR9_3489 [Gordonia sp. KTR9]
MAKDLKVFISWSGDPSKDIALIWHELVNQLFDTVTPFVSDTDIEAGARGLDDIKNELDGTSFAIVVVTRANQSAPWLNFEAGAISRQMGSDYDLRVAPCLVDFEKATELTSPLKQFQANLLNEEGITKILASIARAADVEWNTKAGIVAAVLPSFLERFLAIRDTAPPPEVPKRSPDAMVEEVLELVRELHRESMGTTARAEAERSNSQKSSTIAIDDPVAIAALVARGIITEVAGKSSSAQGLDYKVRTYDGGIIIAELLGFPESMRAEVVEKMTDSGLFLSVREVGKGGSLVRIAGQLKLRRDAIVGP